MTRDDAARVERFLGEFRMMVTAVGVLVAFQLQAVFSTAFLDAGPFLQRVHIVGTLFGVAAFACFLIPASVHRITSQVRNAETFIDLARSAIGVGFTCLAVALVLGVFAQSARVLGRAWGAGAGMACVLILAVAWSLVPRWFAREANES